MITYNKLRGQNICKKKLTMKRNAASETAFTNEDKNKSSEAWK